MDLSSSVSDEKKSQVFNGPTKKILDLFNFMLVGKGEQKYEHF